VNAEIIAIGSEMLTPYRSDTNSLHLTAKLNDLGVEVLFKTIVGDNRQHLVSVARIALTRADIVIFMGGLGPTEDDVTREAVAEALSLELKRDPALIAELKKVFAARGYQMTPNNAKQADVIAGATVLKNPRGTAPGQWLVGKYDNRERIVMLLPGPPRELVPMFDDECLHRLRAKLPPLHIGTKTLKVAMMGESMCDSKIAPIYKQHPEIQTTLLAGAGEIEINLRSRAPSPAEAQAQVDKLAGQLEDALGDHIFSTNGESLEQIVGYYLQMHDATLAVAESCTGGLLGERITSVAGSSRYFLGGAIAYSNDLKTRLADVPPLLLAEHGAVSREVAAALAEGIRARCSATLGIGITGVAGPSGATDEKPVGRVYHALADEEDTDVIERTFPGDRQRIRWFATQQALDMIRRKLM
jgi:nicotinamide-nucleotide amidase